MLSQKTDYLNVPSLPASITVTNPNPIQFIATPLLTDGAVGTRVILYDDTFGGDYQMNVWSGEINLVFDTLTAEDQWTFQPMIGFKHTEYSEKLAFGGSFSNVSGFNVGAPVITDPVSNRIESDVTNWQYSMQFGFRSEFDYKVLTFGIEPKIAFGSNYARASVLTDNLREPGDVTGAVDDPTVLTADTRVVFAPTFDLGVYAKIHLTEWMNLRVGYNLVWLGRVSTAERNIYYNDIDDTQPPQVSVRQRFGSRVIDGISIGGEIILP